jgi:hypothetical protein
MRITNTKENIMKVKKMAVPIAIFVMVVAVIFTVALTPAMADPSDVCKDSIRLYGTFGEGAGNLSAIDNETGLPPENKPYSCPEGPFFPQHNESPNKDFMTFNPAIMEHNQGYPELSFASCNGTLPKIQEEKEKVFKRMWYEKDWYKDHDADGCWDVVVEEYNEDTGEWEYNSTMCLRDWNAMPEWQKVKDKLRLREWNNDMSINDSNVDLYAPSILQEFTYMFADQETMPRMIQNGSKVLIPMASYVPNNGIDSFDADGDGDRDALRIESEATLGMDIDGDGTLEPMDGDGIELSGDETIVLVLDSTRLIANTSEDTLQLFDHIVTLEAVYDVPGLTAEIRVCDNEGGDQACEDISLGIGQVAYFYRGGDAGGEPTFYIKFLTGDAGADEARVEVGRMFGQTYANIGANPYWSQKAFMVDCVLYNVVAIKAQDNCTKFITIRQKLPKMPIKLFGKDLCVWGPNVTLPELPPFNEEHEGIASGDLQ